MNDLVAGLDELEVGNIERSNGAEREVDDVLGPSVARALEILAHLAERAKYPGSIESLAFTMIAVAHKRGSNPPLGSWGSYQQDSRDR